MKTLLWCAVVSVAKCFVQKIYQRNEIECFLPLKAPKKVRIFAKTLEILRTALYRAVKHVTCRRTGHYYKGDSTSTCLIKGILRYAFVLIMTRLHQNLWFFYLFVPSECQVKIIMKWDKTRNNERALRHNKDYT